MTPYRRMQPRPFRAFGWMSCEVEIVVGAVCAFVLAAGLIERDFGAGTTLAMLGLVFVVRSVVFTALSRPHASSKESER
jgi:hypothetical protein